MQFKNEGNGIYFVLLVKEHSAEINKLRSLTEIWHFPDPISFASFSNFVRLVNEIYT